MIATDVGPTNTTGPAAVAAAQTGALMGKAVPSQHPAVVETWRLTAQRLLGTVAVTTALALTACGDDDSNSGDSAKPQKLAIEVTAQGKNKFRVSAPKSVQAGLVRPAPAVRQCSSSPRGGTSSSTPRSRRART